MASLWLELCGLYVDDAVYFLQRTLDKQKLAACDGDSLALEEGWRDDDVGDAGFVFE